VIREPLADALFQQIAQLPTVDAHEHLHAEPLRTSRRVDIFLLFHQYLFTQLIAAGMDPQRAEALGSESEPLERKWESLAPYLELVRTCSCARPPFEALAHYFGESDLTAANYASLSARIQESNRPGLFDRCLRQACNIVLVLNQNRTMWQTEMFRPILPEDVFLAVRDRQAIETFAAEDKAGPPATLAAYVDMMAARLERRVREGMIGVKGMCYAYRPGQADVAASAYWRVVTGGGSPADTLALTDYLRDQLYTLCGRLGIVVVKHSGVWSGGWADHTNIRSTNIMPVAARHRTTRFDLFHAGTPNPEDAGLIARGFPSVWLNLCWSHLLSPVQSAHALDVWLDLAPVNRFIAFGGDYWWAVENVYGALKQAREIVARVLARRVRDGGITEAKAVDLARRWFHDNPRELYRV